MALESATSILELNKNNPRTIDGRFHGDNHIRLIKEVLQTQFPNLGEDAVTATIAELNELFGNKRYIPSKAVVMWSGSIASIPVGWVLCNGSNGTPNLEDKFTMASTNSIETELTTGGSKNINFSRTEKHTLTLDEIPSHSHTMNDHDTQSTSPTNRGQSTQVGSGSNLYRETRTASQGSNEGHSHTIEDLPNKNIPNYYVLAYIMKV